MSANALELNLMWYSLHSLLYTLTLLPDVRTTVMEFPPRTGIHALVVTLVFLQYNFFQPLVPPSAPEFDYRRISLLAAWNMTTISFSQRIRHDGERVRTGIHHQKVYLSVPLFEDPANVRSAAKAKPHFGGD